MALVQDRNTHKKQAAIIVIAVAAGANIFAGALVVANASGYAAAGSTASDLTYLGRADEHVDNTAGINGAKSVKISRLQAFKFKNDGSITQAHIGKPSYIVDDETVAATNGSATRSAAGTIIEIDSDGVWIE